MSGKFSNDKKLDKEEKAGGSRYPWLSKVFGLLTAAVPVLISIQGPLGNGDKSQPSISVFIGEVVISSISRQDLNCGSQPKVEEKEVKFCPAEK